MLRFPLFRLEARQDEDYNELIRQSTNGRQIGLKWCFSEFSRENMMFRNLITAIFVLFILPSFLQAQELDLGNIPLDDTIPVTAATTAVAPATPVRPASDVSEPVAMKPDEESTSTRPGKKVTSFWSIIAAGGLIGYIIILLSFVSIALMIEHGLTIREKVLMPPGFAEDILGLLNQGQLATAIQKCAADSSTLAKILYGSMSEFELGWSAVEKGGEEATAEEASRLYRKTEYLNVIGNIAPMLGLLGTVVGMIYAFQQLADSEGYARAADLAEGIYLALVTTVQGLIVAIPSLAAYSIFNNRIAFLIAETTFVAEQVLLPVKKSLYRKSVQGRPASDR